MSIRIPLFARRLVAALAAVTLIALACTGPLRAAPEDDIRPPPPKPPKNFEDIRIPIPFSPDVQSNGCHARQSPTEQAIGDGTEIPFWRLIEHAALRYAVRLTVDGADKFTAKIAPLDDDMHRLVLLFTLWDSMAYQGDGLSLFFDGKSGAIAPIVRDALQSAGLKRESTAFSQAMALFGDNYPIDNDAREKFFDSSASNGRITPFNRRMLASSADFGPRDSFSKSIVDYVDRTPTLWQRIEGLREKLSETDRLRALIGGFPAIDFSQPYAEIERRLSVLSKPRRTLFVVAAFNSEFENGGVHQFFFNSGGALAPEVYDAMLELGLTRQAAIFKRGLDMFGKPYIRDIVRRRDTDFKGDWNDWDKQLSGLTDEFYALDGGLEFHAIGGGMTVEGGPGIENAMLKYARRNHLLPC
jgi:hypothetical protein